MAGGAGGPWPTLEFRSSDFSEILRFRWKITDVGLALRTFEQFRFFASLSILPTTSALFLLFHTHFPYISSVLSSVYKLCTSNSNKLRRSCTIKACMYICR